MARIQSPPLLSQIQGARSYSEQATGLRALRDEITGHSQRKERWIQNGVLELLVNILQNNGPSPKSSSGKERSQIGQPQGLSEDVTVRLLSLQLIASFAYGECAIHRSGIEDMFTILTQSRRLRVSWAVACRQRSRDNYSVFILEKQPPATRLGRLADY
jgi:hypothetical protein